MRTVVTGATGFIGKRLCALLTRERHSIIAVSRDADRARKSLGAGILCISWSETSSWQKAVAEADAVFHLAGESIGGQRWTPEYKETILSSRVETTRAVALAGPRILLSASGVGYYGDHGNEVITEETPAGSDFLAKVCVAWEAEAQRAAEQGGRVACLRTGIALGEGGPLQEMLHPSGVPFSPWKLGLGGPLGNGKQWMPWIHVDDLARLYLWLAERSDLSGAFNAVASKPVTNRDFSHALGHALHRPSLVPVPEFALKLVVGEFAYALLYSQRVVPERVQASGFRFNFPEIGPALREIAGG